MLIVSYFYEVQNQTSKYAGVCWKQDNKKWSVQLQHNQKKYFGGYYDDQENAAMRVNLLCDQLEIERKNPTINIKLNKIQQVTNHAASKLEKTTDFNIKNA